MQRYQVGIYLAGLAVGALLGLLAPPVAGPATAAIDPLLVALLYVTFLGIPFGRIAAALRDWRFLACVLAVNFLAVPVVAGAVAQLVADDRVLFVGVLFVLLAPCVDYVIVFSGLAGGATDRLSAAAPVLMLVQMIALAPYLWLFAGSEVAASIEVGPFVRALVVIIVLPLVAAAFTQAVGFRAARTVESFAETAMVPIMACTLAVVVASQIADVRDEIASLLHVVPVFLLFAVLMAPVAYVAGRSAGLGVSALRSVVFSGVTRNSLVILPLVLALPAEFDLAPLVVVTQTLVELILMVAMVRAVPRLVR